MLRNTVLGFSLYSLKALSCRTSHPLIQVVCNYSVQNSASSLPSFTSFSKSKFEDRGVKVSKAMKAYLERAQKHEHLMSGEIAEYELGKRHLANMMGADPETFTQLDIDRAIEYLMPSGIFDWRARPWMKHPKEVFPKSKEAQFDETGRPFNTFFYTNQSAYYELMHKISDQFEQMNEFEDKMIKKGISSPPEEVKINLAESEWITLTAFQELILETVSEQNFKYFILSMSHFVEHPYSHLKKDFIMQFRKNLVSSLSYVEIPPLTIGEDGRPFAKAIGSRKKLRNEVIVYGNGTGQVDINGHDISFFESFQDREQILFPLQFTGLLNEVDVVAKVDTSVGGHTGWAGSVRHGISLALMSFVATEMVDKMRLAGLIQRDLRYRERKKPGQAGARAKFTWKKR